ncbi:MAG TPA: DUF1801 domain-containing protein [Desulfocapsa sulfexigens]|nr:DUF1801 domain-containing protein [Desulfocapsa sulfexigens]
MKKSQDKKVQGLINDIEMYDSDKYQLLMNLRDLAFHHHPKTQERVMYGGIMFSLVNDYGGIFVRKNHISFEFTSGNEFQDPEKLLEGKGKFRRHLKLRSLEDIENKKVSYYIQQIQ